ncbi:hypothetical protein BDV32DRAFT_146451 [Aspergillus pseudonomiae]|uniref:Uncharacterized protein n=1 Tax=Aspergillus pseudonomiae TaxID=1506151 RepID=A0A5N7DR44_9EURO|nr:uncharacterized protein BDV37DRAFT_278986 [Aspergillus pseudonomiae]KAB8263635.1 hypothetical protein BDV32DRAFT_146451 [Aspergillus pseudonomiae]KAE8408499.1 hypothetical protein BDV37DRAFT_278986 [Aspergillus pseudonomiae]
MATGTAAETASVGFQTADSSFHVDHIPLKQCFDVHAEDVTAIYVSQYCRVFLGRDCTEKQVLLSPGEHESPISIPVIDSVWCESRGPFGGL